MSRWMPRKVQSRLFLTHLWVGLSGVLLVSLIAGYLLFTINKDNTRKNTQDLAQVAAETQVSPIFENSQGQGTVTENDQRTVILLIIVSLVTGLGVGILGYFFANYLSRPIQNLAHSAGKASFLDEQGLTPGFNDPYEVNLLVDAFNNISKQAQKSLKELRSFVANASHELRTPLTSVKLRVEALRSGALDDPAVGGRFLAEIESEIDRLGRMVDDMLDLSRIEAGMTQNFRAQVDLAAIVSEVCEAFGVRAERAELALRCSVEVERAEINGVEEQLRRMLYNLIDNAIKYTSRGGHVDVVLQHGEDKKYLVLIVKDTGFGIAPSHLPHIFERFYRVEATRPRYGPPRGSGLGLPIAKSIVDSHGGRIDIASEVGRGTTFKIFFPVNVN